MATADDSRWYGEGLKFECTQCGNCCSGAPGYVWVTEEEIERIAGFIGRKRLGREHLRRVGEQFSLTEDRGSGDCCFLKRLPDGKRVCGVYPVRPLQCRTWPFWDDNLETRSAWAEAARGCPGMNKGPRYSLVQIEIRRTARTWEEAAG